MKRSLWIVPLILLIGLAIYGLNATYNKPFSPPPNPNALETLPLPSRLSKNVLEVTLPHCAISNIRTDDNKQNTGIYFAYKVINYSGNLKNEFHCPTQTEQGLLTTGEILPFYPSIKEGGIPSDEDYFDVENHPRQKFIIAKNKNVQVIKAGDSDILHISHMPNQTHPLQISYYAGNAKDVKSNQVSPFSNYYHVQTVIQDEFRLRYTFFIVNPETANGYNLSDYNTKFAEDHRNVERQSGNILEYPDILQGFVDNNERVVKFINAHTTLIKTQN